jgi:ankyrin repeat protein
MASLESCDPVFDRETSQDEMHLAVKANDCSRLYQLIRAGHSVNKESMDMVRPLHDACFHGYIDCVKLLLDNDAEVTEMKIYGDPKQ